MLASRVAQSLYIQFAVHDMCLGYTSNNVESINHVLKNATSWRMQKLPVLVQSLKKIVMSQYRDAEKAMYGEGPYMLKQSLRSRFQVTYDEWADMDVKQRQRRIKACFQLPSASVTSTSTNGLLTVSQSPAAGRKPNQRKRPPNERTTSFKRRRTQLD